MIEYLTLILAIPLGIALAHMTKDEKQIYSNAPYFPIILWAIAFAAAIFYITNEQVGLTLTFVFLMTFVWNKA